jgi:hypothetical protein
MNMMIKGELSKNNENIFYSINNWWQPYQQTFGTSYVYYRCYLPVLAGFIGYNCEVTSRATIATTIIEIFKTYASVKI